MLIKETKIMKQNISLIASLVFLVQGTFLGAQEYKFSPQKEVVLLRDVNIIQVKGYDGKEIVLLNMDQPEEQDDIDRTAGLKKLNPLGLDDNSGIGLSVLEEDGKILITQTNNSMLEGEYTMRVPRNLAVYIENTSAHADDLAVENINGELVISTNYSSIDLNQVTGPMAVKSVYGDIDVKFERVNTESPSEVHSVYGFVDVSVPEASKINLVLETYYGEIFSDLNVKINVIDEINKTRTSNQCYDYGSEISGSLNGGGTQLSIKANHDNIYLRKL